MEISPALMERVDAGIEWADENIPDWREHVDPKRIDMGHVHRCFLGQYWHGRYGYGEFLTAYKAYFQWNSDRTNELGFTSDNYAELNAAWRQKFVELGMLNESPES